MRYPKKTHHLENGNVGHFLFHVGEAMIRLSRLTSSIMPRSLRQPTCGHCCHLCEPAGRAGTRAARIGRAATECSRHSSRYYLVLRLYVTKVESSNSYDFVGRATGGRRIAQKLEKKLGFWWEMSEGRVFFHKFEPAELGFQGCVLHKHGCDV